MKKEKAAKRSQAKELEMKSEVNEFEKKRKKSKAEKAQEVAEEVPLKATSKPKKKMKTTKASRVQSEELEGREGSLKSWPHYPWLLYPLISIHLHVLPQFCL